MQQYRAVTYKQKALIQQLVAACKKLEGTGMISVKLYMEGTTLIFSRMVSFDFDPAELHSLEERGYLTIDWIEEPTKAHVAPTPKAYLAAYRQFDPKRAPQLSSDEAIIIGGAYAAADGEPAQLFHCTTVANCSGYTAGQAKQGLIQLTAKKYAAVTPDPDTFSLTHEGIGLAQEQEQPDEDTDLTKKAVMAEPVSVAAPMEMLEVSARLLTEAAKAAPTNDPVDYRAIGITLGWNPQQSDSAYALLATERYVRPLWPGHFAVTRLGAARADELNGVPKSTYPVNDSPENSPPTQAMSIVDAMRMCADSITKFRINRQNLVRIYIELLKLEDGKWRGICKRGSKSGDLVVKGKGFNTSDDGKLSGPGIVTDHNPFAPIRDFKLIDQDGKPPAEGSVIFDIQQKMFYFTEEIRVACAVLLQLLPQFEFVAPNLGIDPTALTRLRHRLPGFPYIPVRTRTIDMPVAAGETVKLETDVEPNFTPADREKTVAEDEPYLAAAMVTLDHLLQAHVRWEQMVASRGNTMGNPNAEEASRVPTNPTIAFLWNAILTGTKVSRIYKMTFGSAFAVLIVGLARLLIGRWEWALLGVIFVAAMTVIWLLLEVAQKLKSEHLRRPAITLVWAVVIAFVIALVIALALFATFSFKAMLR